MIISDKEKLWTQFQIDAEFDFIGTSKRIVDARNDLFADLKYTQNINDVLKQQNADLVAALDELLKSQKTLMQNNNLDNLAEDMFRVTNAVVKAQQVLAQAKGVENA